MKRFIIAACALTILGGCQQADQLQKDATRAVNDASQQLETAKTSVLDTQSKIEQKVKDAQAAADAVKKLTE
jgi:outer membrane lipoprotein-sorting protein